MKIRTSFVANSSSSSFIIAYKEFPKIKLPKSIPKWVVALTEKSLNSITEPDRNFCDEGSDVVKNEKELQEYAMDRWAYGYKTFDEWINNDLDYGRYYQEDYEQYLSIVNDGYSICFREVDYNNGWMSNFLESLPKKDDGSGLFLIKSEN